MKSINILRPSIRWKQRAFLLKVRVKNVQNLTSCAELCTNQSARLAQSAWRMRIEQRVFWAHKIIKMFNNILSPWIQKRLFQTQTNVTRQGDISRIAWRIIHTHARTHTHTYIHNIHGISLLWCIKGLQGKSATLLLPLQGTRHTGVSPLLPLQTRGVMGTRVSMPFRTTEIREASVNKVKRANGYILIYNYRMALK
jgi:hypothetical protein